MGKIHPYLQMSENKERKEAKPGSWAKQSPSIGNQDGRKELKSWRNQDKSGKVGMIRIEQISTLRYYERATKKGEGESICIRHRNILIIQIAVREALYLAKFGEGEKGQKCLNSIRRSKSWKNVETQGPAGVGVSFAEDDNHSVKKGCT